MLTDEEAEIALKMGVRKPKTMPEMVKSEDKLKYVLPNMIKQSLKVTFAPKKD